MFCVLPLRIFCTSLVNYNLQFMTASEDAGEAALAAAQGQARTWGTHSSHQHSIPPLQDQHVPVLPFAA
jgi:hypothetical protein